MYTGRVLITDFSRFICPDKQSLITVLGVAIGSPVVLVFATIPTIITSEVYIFQIMKAFSLVIPAFILLFLFTWTINSTNLYSITLIFCTVYTIKKKTGDCKYRNKYYFISFTNWVVCRQVLIFYNCRQNIQPVNQVI